MKVAYKIDWLSMTKKVTNAGKPTLSDLSDLIQMTREFAMDLGIFNEDHEIEPSNRFYDIKMSFPRIHISISASFDIERQGFLVVATGKSFDNNDIAVLWLRQAIDSGWKPTRIDLALDLFDSGITVEDVMLSYELEHAMNRQRKTQYIRSSRGDTFYIGSRQSEKMMRVYDKAGEQALSADWVRYELELKGDAAIQVVPHILAEFKRTAMLHVAMLSLPNSNIGVLLENFAQGEPIELRSTPSTKDGHEKWLLGVVANALAKTKVDNHDLYEHVMDTVHELATQIALDREFARLRNQTK